MALRKKANERSYSAHYFGEKTDGRFGSEGEGLFKILLAGILIFIQQNINGQMIAVPHWLIIAFISSVRHHLLVSVIRNEQPLRLEKINVMETTVAADLVFYQ